MTAIHGLIQTARGMCTDERPYPEIDELLGHAVDAAKYIEAERDELRITLDVCDQELDMEMALSDHYRQALVEIMERNRLDTSNPLGGSARAFHIARRALLPTKNQEDAQ